MDHADDGPAVTGRVAQLWGGPMDGERIALGAGEQPATISMARAGNGALATVTGPGELPAGAQVYEHITLGVLRAWRAAVGPDPILFDSSRILRLEDVPLYVHRELVTRWLAAPN